MDEDGQASNIAALVLAAGQSRRMGDFNKLAAEVRGKALVRHVAEAATQSSVNSVHVVTGFEPETVGELLEGLSVAFHHNERYEEGLSTSLSTGIGGLDDDADFAMVLLGDMPFVSASHLNHLAEVARTSPVGSIIVATSAGKRGNPVIWPRAYFDQLRTLEGDVGARHIIGQNQEMVVEVELGEAASADLDTPEALMAAGGWFAGE